MVEETTRYARRMLPQLLMHASPRRSFRYPCVKIAMLRGEDYDRFEGPQMLHLQKH